MKTKADFKVGERVDYSNGDLSIYNGKIVKIKDKSLIVIDDEAGMELWNAGYAVGSEISFSQVK